MKALMVLALAILMTGCSVNVIVAPHATLAVDSANERVDTSNLVFPGTEFEVVE
jgi:hypothetical protein